MEPLAWTISLIAAGLLGYHYSRLVKRVKLLTDAVASLGKKPDTKPRGTVIDPDDPVAVARQEFEERKRRLNG